MNNIRRKLFDAAPIYAREVAKSLSIAALLSAATQHTLRDFFSDGDTESYSSFDEDSLLESLRDFCDDEAAVAEWLKQHNFTPDEIVEILK